MKQLSSRCIAASLRRFCDSTIRRFNGLPVLLSAAVFFPAVARPQIPLPDAMMTHSITGQFVVVASNPDLSAATPPLAVTNAEYVRLQPALLAVTAERVRQPLWRGLGLDPMSQWRGRIYLALHPAASLDENVAIISTRFAGVWNYRVELPDVLSRTRLTRALTGVVLLELANRDNAGDRSAELPAWLTEGFARQLFSENLEMIMVPPDRLVNGLPESRMTVVERGVDALATARPILQDHPALTFDQLNWPSGAQLNGDDGGVYRASAQLFVNQLLGLDHGAEHLRAMLQMLPRCYNWQTAFRSAFAEDFPRPIDLEKWWALQTASFAASDAGPLWTPAASRDRLHEVLSVPVEMRSAPTNLPAYAVVSLQAVIRNFDFNRQTAILQTKLRDLQLAGWRMAPQFAGLTDAYHRALANYLGGRKGVAPSKKKVAAALKQLDALDARRRAMETANQPDAPANQIQ